MILLEDLTPEVQRLIHAACQGTLTAADAAALEQALLSDERLRQVYSHYFLMDAHLCHYWESQRALDNAIVQIAIADSGEVTSTPLPFREGLGEGVVSPRQTKARMPMVGSLPQRATIWVPTAIIALAFIAVAWFFLAPFHQVAAPGVTRSLLVHNPSFELPIAGYEGKSVIGVGGWRAERTSPAKVLTIRPQHGRFGVAEGASISGMDGQQMALLYGSEAAELYQPLPGEDQRFGTLDDPVLEAGSTYTLTVAVGRQKDTWTNRSGEPLTEPFKGFEIALLAGGAVLARETGPAPAAATIEDRTVSFTALPGDSRLGLPLTVRLSGPVGASQSHVYFDNVRVMETRKH